MNASSSHRRPVRRAASYLSRGFARGVLGTCCSALLLAACTGPDVIPPCPQLEMLKDTDRQVKFVGEGHDLTDVEFEASLRTPTLSCSYDGDVVKSLVTFDLVALRGPADDDRMAHITYFVGIVDRNKRVLTRKEYEVDVPFEGNRTQVMTPEEVEQRIPLKTDETGADYRVFVGLRLTPDELRYNQENR